MSLKRVGILLGKEFLHGSRNYIFIFSIVGPILISVVISLAFGTWLADAPRMGIYDEGDSSITSMVGELDSVESREYDSANEMKQAVEDGKLDMGIILPYGFDDLVVQDEATEIKAYVWGESLAKNRTIIGATLSDLMREMAGQEVPVNITTTTLGEDVSLPWADRLLPFIVLIAIFLGGLMLPATSLAVEREKKTLQALVVTPVSLNDIFLSKGLLGFILSVFMGILILILNQAFGHQPLLLVMVLALGAIMASELGMLLGAFVKDFATIFTVWKTAGIILFAPVFVFLFPQIPEWVGNIFPTYYILHPVIQISQYGGGWAEIATNTFILFGIDAIIFAILLITLRKKQYAITSA